MKKYLSTALFLLSCLSIFAQDWVNDPDFLTGTGANNIVFATIEQPDGKILVGGQFTSFNNTATGCLVRLNPDGSIDPGFALDTAVTGAVATMQLQADGKILISSGSVFVSGVQKYLVRLHADGSLDTGYTHENTMIGHPSTSVLQADGKLILGGSFNSTNPYNSVTTNSIVRFNTDGSLDTTFHAGSGTADHGINSLSLQADGRIIAGGWFESFDGTPMFNLVRLHADGTLDPSFNTGTGTGNGNIIMSTSVLPDGKILIAGYFSTYNGATAHAIARLNPDGSLDTSFDPGAGASDYIYTCIAQPNGKILIGGRFTMYNNQPANQFARLNADGSLDPHFFISTGPNGYIGQITLQSDGKILLCGEFTTFAGIQKNYFTRLEPGCYPTSGFLSIHAADNYFWEANATTYDTSGHYTAVLVNAAGCDSTVTMDLHIFPFLVNAFTTPAYLDQCDGSISITAQEGLADYTFNLDGELTTTSGFLFADSLCPGIHSLLTYDANGDSVTTIFVIPASSNHILIDPFPGAQADSLAIAVENCDIAYNSIDTAFIAYSFVVSNEVMVGWAIFHGGDTTVIHTSFPLVPGNNYYLQLQLYCPYKALGDYFAVTEGVAYVDGALSTLGTAEERLATVSLYPNPAREEVTISCSEPMHLSVLDIQGKTVARHNVQDGDQVSLRDLQPGIYLFELTTGDTRKVHRIVKQ